MLKLVSVAIIGALLFAVAAFAQEQGRRDQRSDTAVEERRSGEARPSARQTTARNSAATPAPGAATPAPERRGFFKRLFGRRGRPEATPTPAPKTRTTVPPPATRKSRRSSSETSNDSENPRSEKPRTKTSDRSEDSPSTSDEKASSGAEKKQAEPEKDSSADAPKKKGSKEGRARNATPPPELATPEAQEKWKYDEARKRALEDADVQALKQKAESSIDPDEGRRALRAYNKALFNKMRSIDPSVKDRIDAIEAGVMKRLGE